LLDAPDEEDDDSRNELVLVESSGFLDSNLSLFGFSVSSSSLSTSDLISFINSTEIFQTLNSKISKLGSWIVATVETVDEELVGAVFAALSGGCVASLTDLTVTAELVWK
jgi:hypothetical protein